MLTRPHPCPEATLIASPASFRTPLPALLYFRLVVDCWLLVAQRFVLVCDKWLIIRPAACLPCLKHAQDFLTGYFGMAHASCQRRVASVVLALNARCRKVITKVRGCLIQLFYVSFFFSYESALAHPKVLRERWRWEVAVWREPLCIHC